MVIWKQLLGWGAGMGGREGQEMSIYSTSCSSWWSIPSHRGKDLCGQRKRPSLQKHSNWDCIELYRDASFLASTQSSSHAG